mmetsp:Transcript_26407/g.66646  ORF Transcript_26407/g.66646 Transcript_26407/m.66646 type:complete len:202 (+) Transcript_26407:726-1331(+)
MTTIAPVQAADVRAAVGAEIGAAGGGSGGYGLALVGGNLEMINDVSRAAADLGYLLAGLQNDLLARAVLRFAAPTRRVLGNRNVAKDELQTVAELPVPHHHFFDFFFLFFVLKRLCVCVAFSEVGSAQVASLPPPLHVPRLACVQVLLVDLALIVLDDAIVQKLLLPLPSRLEQPPPTLAVLVRLGGALRYADIQIAFLDV